jgi:hypothetical protein
MLAKLDISYICVKSRSKERSMRRLFFLVALVFSSLQAGVAADPGDLRLADGRRTPRPGSVNDAEP